MIAAVAPYRLSDGLARAVCSRLGVPWPEDLAGIARLYRAWCAQVPFDNVAKVLAVRDGRTPPGAEPEEVVERWLATGVGATCWGHVTGLAGVLGAAGSDSRIAVDRMRRDDDIVDFHAFVIVEDGTEAYVCDPIHASAQPLPWRDGARGAQGPYRTGLDREGRRFVHWYEIDPDGPDALADPGRGSRRHRRAEYVVLATDLDRHDIAAFCAIAATHSGVNGRRLYSRRFPDAALLEARPDADGRALVVTRQEAGAPATTVAHPDVEAALAGLGYTAEGRRLVERAGLLRRVGAAWQLTV